MDQTLILTITSETHNCFSDDRKSSASYLTNIVFRLKFQVRRQVFGKHFECTTEIVFRIELEGDWLMFCNETIEIVEPIEISS